MAIFYLINPDGSFGGEIEADGHTLPAGVVDIPPPADIPADKVARWIGSGWFLFDQPEPDEPAV